MSVHRELAAELRANKAVIDSLNNRNEQLLRQNQRLKQEIHHVVQAAVSLGHTAGVTRGAKNSVYNSSRSGLRSDKKEPLTKNTGAKHTGTQRSRLDAASASSNRTQSEKQRSEKKTGKQTGERPNTQRSHLLELIDPNLIDQAAMPYEPSAASAQITSPSTHTLVHQPISEGHPTGRSGKKQISKLSENTSQQPQKDSKLSFQFSAMMPKLFTEESGSHHSSLLEKSAQQEISGIWLALSILLIVVTAFGAGFLIMKPLLGRR
ncbi:hypothetical protein S7335_5349 [Synechococcus sp. PCC 7335]|nr:hypothetical protein S7335_5349 [Synechococcus sp. PCC 7335]